MRGGYPEIALDPKRDTALWHRSYMQTYLERDVRTLRQVGDLTQFQDFLRALAAHSGQLLNLSDLSRDLGIVVNTAKAWLSALEASFQVVVVRPYFANVGKRLVKTPKVYFADTGTLCFLTRLRSGRLAAHCSKPPYSRKWPEPCGTEAKSRASTSGAQPLAKRWTSSSSTVPSWCPSKPSSPLRRVRAWRLASPAFARRSAPGHGPAMSSTREKRSGLLVDTHRRCLSRAYGDEGRALAPCA